MSEVKFEQKLVIGRQYDLTAFRRALGADALTPIEVLNTKFKEIVNAAKARYDYPAALVLGFQERLVASDWRELKNRIKIENELEGNSKYSISIRTGNEQNQLHLIATALDALVPVEDFKRDLAYIHECWRRASKNFDKATESTAYSVLRRYQGYLDGKAERLSEQEVDFIRKFVVDREKIEAVWRQQEERNARLRIGTTGLVWRLAEDGRFHPAVVARPRSVVLIKDLFPEFCERLIKEFGQNQNSLDKSTEEKIEILKTWAELRREEEKADGGINVPMRDRFFTQLRDKYPPPQD
jgi:hypothetical protein